MNVEKKKSGQPRISICIPTYNAARYIKKTIKSILDSTYSNIEIIVSDDVSDDNTINILKELNDKRIHLIKNDSRLGVPKNWNRALKEATGEFIGLLNHDDIYCPFWLTFAAYTLKKYPHIGWMATAFYIINEKDEVINFVAKFPETREYSLAETFSYIAKLNGLGPGFIARRTVFEEIGYYDEDAGPGADNDLFLRISSKFPLYYSNYPHASWRWHKDNLTKRWEPINQAVEGLRILEKIFNNEELPIELMKYKKSCFANYYRKISNHAEALLRKGEIENSWKLKQLLKSHNSKVN